MNKKEFKEYWNSKTVGELRGYIEERKTVLNNTQEIIKDLAQDIINLDVLENKYITKLNDLSNKIKNYTKEVKEDTERINILSPVLEAKEIEGINQAEYERYITDNKINIKILIKKVNDIKEENREYFKNELNMSNKDVDYIHDFMLKELIWMLKDNIGNIINVKSLKYNGNRGFDGEIEGDNGKVYICTILAGGHHIQKLHYRTLIHRC